MCARLLALLCLASLAHAVDDGAWERVTERDGLVIERRAVEGSAVRELRVTGHSPLPPATIMATLWKHEDYVQFVPYLKRLDVLRDDGDVKLIYQQIRVPLTKDRDSTVRVRRAFDPATGSWEVTSTAVPDEGPPASDDYVRVRTSEGRWRLVPSTDGGTSITYTIRTDAGGRLPAWIVNAAQKDVAAKLVQAMLDRAAHENPSLRAPP
jgi:ribosome-associated toxin RatA of RatAB toxin-antitoxin module